MSLIKAENLSLNKGSKYLIKEVNWEVGPGENWVLFGANGCGKTTLLSILSGYYSANDGANYLFDEKVDKENYLSLRNRVGFVSSSFFNRYLHTEIVQEIILAGKFGMLGMQENVTDEDIRKAKKLGRDLGICSMLRYPYDCLSRGQQQRVLIARALMNDPELLLLDEPCSGLDIMAREKFLRNIQRIAQERNMAIIYVTHHTEEILPFFNKTALMKNGEIVAQDDLKKIFTDEMLSDYFEADAHVVWTDKHFFISLDLDHDHTNSDESFAKRQA